ncbi:ABC transporter substrate-binding protein [Rhodoplanes sp. Z2-YC6860]|uniref:ABC transporter substrate-binding protein n=1 Tax=Rhodoplanes sp. Z2-YC6860 TaxID=674703 RepID=UPI00078C9B33|nr:ABC transporter substrate-binding protein [Rhodoplanes sp. Z2-YC6860]AMN45265.1 ABC transporter substrate-binding protein [Rhodoplanes sp. Z2-YC6860]
MINRRKVVQGMGAGVGLFAMPSIVRAQELRKIRMGFGIKSVNPIIINILISEGLGYTKEEGLQFTPLALGTNSNAQIAVDKGDTEFAVGTPSFQFPLFAKGQLPPIVNFYEYTYPYKWDVAVKPDSAVQKYEDLKGKKIGVSDLGTTDYPVTRAVLQNIGVDPDKDVQWLAVGAGVTAGVALQRGVIDALAYFDTGFGQIDAAGIGMRMLPRPKNIPLIGGLFLSAKEGFLKENRKVAVGFGRAVNKASEFLLANPEAGARVFLKMYPETAPRGASEADAVKSVLLAAQRRIPLYRPPYENTKMGFIREDELLTDAKFQGLDIKNIKPLYTNEFIDEINDYDHGKIIEQAKSYKT